MKYTVGYASYIKPEKDGHFSASFLLFPHLAVESNKTKEGAMNSAKSVLQDYVDEEESNGRVMPSNLTLSKEEATDKTLWYIEVEVSGV